MAARRASVVLDASAVLAVLQVEPGGDVVADVLDRALISAVNYSEVLVSLVNKGMPFHQAREALHFLHLDIAPFDEGQALAAASLRAVTAGKGLSFGDRACLALARQMTLPALTADAPWAGINAGVDVRLIR